MREKRVVRKGLNGGSSKDRKEVEMEMREIKLQKKIEKTKSKVGTL